MSWITIRHALEQRLATVAGMQAMANTPVALVDDDVAIVLPGLPGIAPMGHANLLEVYARVVVIVNRATVTDSERWLDMYLWPYGSRSVIAAVIGDPTLGGTVDDTFWVSTMTPYGQPDNSPTGRQSEVVFRCAVKAIAGVFSEEFALEFA